MTSDQIRTLLASGENLTVEFKSDREKLSPSEIYKNVVCLANAEGGTLLIGVENNGQVTGLHASRQKEPMDPFFLQAAVFNNTVPAINTRIGVHHFDEGSVIAIEVDAYPTICATKEGVCVRRVMDQHGPACLPFYPIDHLSRRIQLGLEDLSAQPLSSAAWEDLDLQEFERLRRFIGSGPGDRRLLALDDVELAKALKLVESSPSGKVVPLVAGLLMLGKEEAIQRHLPTHKTVFQVFAEGRKLPTNERLSSPLLKQIEELEARFDARPGEGEISLGFQRIPIPAYDRDAFREAIINAIVHRDYSSLGTLYVQWHPDHLSITSPGPFPRGITRENLLTHEPVPRNPRLAEVCNRIGLVETSARGVDLIYEGQLRLGRGLPDYSESDETSVKLRLQSAGANLDFIRFLRTFELQAKRLSLEEVIALHLVHTQKRIGVDLLAATMQRHLPSAIHVLESLVHKGLLEAHGDRAPYYILSASAYRQFGQPSDYVRVRGMDPIRQTAMVESFIKAHGRITRTEAAELCFLDPDEASKLLNRLVDEGKLSRLGAKRGTYYVLNDAPPLKPVAGKELIEKIQAILAMRGASTLQEIDDALGSQGFEVAGHNKRNYLTSVMSRNKAIFRGLGRGRYEIVASLVNQEERQ